MPNLDTDDFLPPFEAARSALARALNYEVDAVGHDRQANAARGEADCELELVARLGYRFEDLAALCPDNADPQGCELGLASIQGRYRKLAQEAAKRRDAQRELNVDAAPPGSTEAGE